MPDPNQIFRSRKRHVSICQLLHLTEENIRFLLLGLILYIYLCFGAFLFQSLEEEMENKMRANYNSIYEEFKLNLTLLNEEVIRVGESDSSKDKLSRNYFVNQITEEDLDKLLLAYAHASKAGAFLRQRWDWSGSFHFAWTIVSTIGYGAATPASTSGRILLIPYGFFGCACGLLFFNLFLERIITFLTSCMRWYRYLIRKRRGFNSSQGNQTHPNEHQLFNNGATTSSTNRLGIPISQTIRRISSQSSTCNSPIQEEANEKPSVTWVMVSLFLMSLIVILCSATIYHHFEGWTFVESIYFAFVSYSTIGFGDFVTFQKISYGTLEILYKIISFISIVLGCCCTYSLLSVTSIVIKRFLNWIIKSLDFQCCICCSCINRRIRSTISTRRNTKRSRELKHRRTHNSTNTSRMQVAIVRVTTASTNDNEHSTIDMEEQDRRFSGENLVSIRSELSNKVSMAVMQKRLYETAQLHRSYHSSVDTDDDSSLRCAGPLAIISEKFGDHPN